MRVSLNKWLVFVLCVTCLLAAGCASDDGLMASGSDEWSRGVVIGSTEADPVAVATWEETTFVAWVAESGRLQLAQLDAALDLESVTELALTTAYPYAAMLLEAEAGDRLHVVWLDSIEGARTIVHARLTPGQSEPAFWQEIQLPKDAEHVQFVIRPQVQRLEVFWSAHERFDSGIYHQAFSLAGGEATPPVQLTETGWQPAAGWGQSGEMLFTWVEAARSGYYAVWRADFDPEEQALDRAAPVAQVRMKRGRRLLGPAVGSAGEWNVVAWTVGWRTSMGRGLDLDAPGGGPQLGAALRRSQGAVTTITSDKGQYVMATAVALAEADVPVYSITTGRVIEIWQAPRIKTAGDRTWAFFSAWVAQRSDVRMQLVVAPFGENGLGAPIIVTKTRPSSVWPDLAGSADGTLRAAWVEPLGNDMFRVVAASTAPEAREALGGFRLAEVWNDALTSVFEYISLLGYVPYIIGWVIAPLGVLLVATFLSPSGVRGRKVAIWLAVAITLQLVGKRFLAPQMLPFELGVEGITLAVTPVVIGMVLMWVYWRRAKEPLLLAAYGLFAVVDAAFSIFVMVPRLLWNV